MTATYDVRVEESNGAWSVHIVDAAGEPVFQRACADEGEAHLFASTVRQHLAWLSPDRFRRYYRLPEA
ncbi:MAG TPA: hypothetical protein VHL78_09020 [Actinomycetota bacterium]|nr:hypothetical protein [Actinomycetota bacterium]